jgi:ribulose-phosphate 3-epimerase
MIEIIPSMPVGSFGELKNNLLRLRGVVSRVQIDVCDGIFVEARSWPMHPEDREEFLRIVRREETLPFKDDFDFEVDLMANNAETLIPEWIGAGVTRALIHIETVHDFEACRVIAKDVMELGVAISLGTPVSRLNEYIPYIQCVQIMGIAHIGVQGQPFDPRVVDVIREVKERYPHIIIEVDGAVNMETAPSLLKAGAERLAPGSFILRAPDPKEAVEKLKGISL